VRVTEDGEYSVEIRIACNSQAGKLEIQQLNKDKQVLQSVVADVPVTGGWQVWQTVTAKINLNAGSGYLRLKIVQPEFNLNWLKFTKTVINGIEKKSQGSLNIFPNPVHKMLHIELPETFREDSTISIISLNGELVRHQGLSVKDLQQDFYVGDLATGIYRIELKSNGKVWSNRFIVQ
jgi:endoglucanase